MTAVIEVSGLVKDFGKFRALDGLDLEVREGEVHGFLGPNGAGKSTTIRILLGMLRATSGSVRLLGGDPWRGGAPLPKRAAPGPRGGNPWAPPRGGGGGGPPRPPPGGGGGGGPRRGRGGGGVGASQEG